MRDTPADTSNDQSDRTKTPIDFQTVVVNMDVQDLEAYSCLKQNTVRFIVREVKRLGVPLTHPSVISAAVQHFNIGTN